jgi:hypothetical protein
MQAAILYGTAWKEDRTAELVRLALERKAVAQAEQEWKPVEPTPLAPGR